MKKVNFKDIKKNLVGGGDYATETGLYIVKDYGDGRVDVSYYNADNNSWGEDEEVTLVEE